MALFNEANPNHNPSSVSVSCCRGATDKLSIHFKDVSKIEARIRELEMLFGTIANKEASGTAPEGVYARKHAPPSVALRRQGKLGIEYII